MPNKRFDRSVEIAIRMITASIAPAPGQPGRSAHDVSSRESGGEMLINKLRRTFIRVLLISALVCCWNPSLQCQPAPTPDSAVPASVLGTWKGESICIGNRPACKNEIVVYRFEAVAGKRDVVLQLADKIIESKRVPMGKLEFQYDEAKGELSCEFTIRQTHGLWQYKVSGDNLEGTLVLLPDRELVRRVNAKRVGEGEVPAAPAKEAYDGT